jgi:hypothetical protein
MDTCTRSACSCGWGILVETAVLQDRLAVPPAGAVGPIEALGEVGLVRAEEGEGKRHAVRAIGQARDAIFGEAIGRGQGLFIGKPPPLTVFESFSRVAPFAFGR